MDSVKLLYSVRIYRIEEGVNVENRYEKISVTLPKGILQRLDEWAVEQGMSRSEAIRHAIRVVTQTKRGKARRSHG